jgi:hypothetical protein
MSEREQEVRRAREVLNGAGWVFDKYRGAQMAVMLSGAAQAEREAAYLRARIVTDIQTELQSVVGEWDYETAVAQRREKSKEK